jgi:hypothetical protein
MPDQSLMDAAQANIAVKYDPQQAALQRQLELSQKNTASTEQSIQGYGTAGRNIIGDTYNTLYGLLGAQKTDTQNSLNQQVGLTNQGYDDAISRLQGYQQSSQNYLAKMAADLGQSGQGLVNAGKMEEILNQQYGYANAAKTNYGSTLSDWVAKMGSLADMGISSAHSTEALKRSEFESYLLQALGQNKLAGTTQETDVINKLADMMNVRQSDLIDMYNQLVSAQWERDFQQASLNEKASEASADNAYKYAALRQSASEGAANRASSAKGDDLALLKFLHEAAQDAAGMEWAKEKFGQEQALGYAGLNKPADYTSYASGLANVGHGVDASGNVIPLSPEEFTAAYQGGPKGYNDFWQARSARDAELGTFSAPASSTNTDTGWDWGAFIRGDKNQPWARDTRDTIGMMLKDVGGAFSDIGKWGSHW